MTTGRINSFVCCMHETISTRRTYGRRRTLTVQFNRIGQQFDSQLERHSISLRLRNTDVTRCLETATESSSVHQEERRDSAGLLILRWLQDSCLLYW